VREPGDIVRPVRKLLHNLAAHVEVSGDETLPTCPSNAQSFRGPSSRLLVCECGGLDLLVGQPDVALVELVKLRREVVVAP